MGLTLSQLGLMIATAILLTVVLTFIFFSDWQRNAELTNIVSGFSNMVEGMDSRYFENTTTYYFPDKGYSYTVTMSTEYIVASANGNWNNVLSIKKRFLIQPLSQSLNNNPDWLTGKAFHQYLLDTYLHNGSRSDPIHLENISQVHSYLNQTRTSIQTDLALQPYSPLLRNGVYIDKVIIYYDTNGDGTWDNEFDEKQDFILIYQLI